MMENKKYENLGSVAVIQFLMSIAIGLSLGIFTYLLGYLPQDDLIQGIWIFITATLSAGFAFSKQIKRFEDKEQRYRRIAQETLAIRLEENPHLTSTLLLAQDAPEMWVYWINEMYGMDLFKCRCIHAVDSLFHFNDLPGQGITRATKWIAEQLKGLENNTSEEKEEAISVALENLVENSQHLLGEQYTPQHFYRHIDSGPLPYGVFMMSKNRGIKSLATTAVAKIVKKNNIESVMSVRLGLNLGNIGEEAWERLVEEIDKLFPCFARKNLGEGPRSLSSQLFIQTSQSVDVDDFKKRLQQLPEVLAKYSPLRIKDSSDSGENSSKSSATIRKEHMKEELKTHIFTVKSLQKDTTYYKLECPEWVNVIPVTEDNQVVLVKQYRFGVDQETLEVPAGNVDPEDADTLAAAKRELMEETGYGEGEWELLGWVHPNPAILSNKCYMYLAKNVKKVGDIANDPHEKTEVILKPMDQLENLILDGSISHSLAINSILLKKLKSK